MATTTRTSADGVAATALRALLVAATQQHPAGDVAELQAGPASAVVAAAQRHRIAPAVYLHLKDTGLPPSWLRPLEESYEDQLLRHLTTTADLAVASRVLAELGAAWAVMKGPVLADRLWPRPDMRQYYDLDIVVERRRFRPAIDALVTAGATLIDRNWPLIRHQHRGELSLELPYGTSLDLHWDLVNDAAVRRRIRLPTEAFLARAIPIRLGELSVPTFDDEDTLLLLAWHAAHAGATRLVWLKDVDLAAAVPALDWGEVDRRGRATGLHLALTMVLDRARRTLSAEIPHPGWRPASGVWPRLARGVDRLVATPGLSDTDHTGQLLYRSARRSSRESAEAAWQQLRHPPQETRARGNPLHVQVDDAGARDAYFDALEAGAGP